MDGSKLLLSHAAKSSSSRQHDKLYVTIFFHISKMYQTMALKEMKERFSKEALEKILTLHVITLHSILY
jgi:hypothetical protein